MNCSVAATASRPHHRREENRGLSFGSNILLPLFDSRDDSIAYSNIVLPPLMEDSRDEDESNSGAGADGGPHWFGMFHTCLGDEITADLFQTISDIGDEATTIVI